MPEILTAELFLKERQNCPVVDVRAPLEFEKGHIPGATNIPVFDNEERALIGTIYTQTGTEVAIQKGKEIASSKLNYFLELLNQIATSNQALMHCWRGGMRSREMAAFYEANGFRIKLLEGGYKAYRTYIRNEFSRNADIRIVGGYTGTGKTEILAELRKQGSQVIDLEGLAHHKGSVFGHLGQKEQPTGQNFENEIFDCWDKMDFQKPIWIEHESMSIGNNFLPDTLYQNVLRGQLFFLKVGNDRRIERILNEYANFSVESLINSISRIERRLGFDTAGNLIELIKTGNYEEVAAQLLVYYDKTYDNALIKKPVKVIKEIEATGLNSAEIASLLNNYKD